MNLTDHLPRYDRLRSYEWNYEHVPQPLDLDLTDMPGDWTFCGRKVGSPLGIPAGPLLNGRWCLYYASLGFDVVTYKTVRSSYRACYPLPNLQPVQCGQLAGGEANLPAIDQMLGSWAVSYGMPSQGPESWRADVQWTRDNLPGDKLLVVSVVGTIEEGWSVNDLADDYARCAKWAVESGADAIETNFSCPNVATCDGQLFQHPNDAALVAARVRAAIGAVPLVAKIGRVVSRDEAEALLDHLGDHVDGLAMTNSIAATVRAAAGELLFAGEKRGICGAATRDASIAQTRMMNELVGQKGLTTRLVGVGGISNVNDVRQYLDAGAHAVQIATAAMCNPAVALEIRQQW